MINSCPSNGIESSPRVRRLHFRGRIESRQEVLEADMLQRIAESGRLMLGFGELLARVGGGLSAVSYAEFAQDGTDVVVDGSLANEQGVGNVGVAVTAGQ
jgi:hypothetical protein